jgi:hypothetical protein
MLSLSLSLSPAHILACIGLEREAILRSTTQDHLALRIRVATLLVSQAHLDLLLRKGRPSIRLRFSPTRRATFCGS